MPSIGSLFSGVGGLDMALEQVFNAETIWQSEVLPSACEVLAERFSVPNLGDVTSVDWLSVPKVDILCGGFPCQDVSSAGFRKGLTSGTRSGLWLAFAEAIKHLRPRFVVIENVRGLLSAKSYRTVEQGPGVVDGTLRAAGRVLGDLADLGYDAQWTTIPASAAGAAHRRERVFILASRFGCGVDPHFTERPTEELVLFHTPAARDGSGLPPHPAYTSLISDIWDLTGRTFPEGWGVPVSRFTGSKFGLYEPAVRRWEMHTRPAPDPSELNKNGDPRLNARFGEWLMGWPDGWVTDIKRPRTETLKLIGNGVVPQQAVMALKTLGIDHVCQV